MFKGGGGGREAELSVSMHEGSLGFMSLFLASNEAHSSFNLVCVCLCGKGVLEPCWPRWVGEAWG